MLLPILLAAPTVLAKGMIDLYIGTYTSKEGSRGIYRAQLDPTNGALSEPTLAVEAESPSYLALHGQSLFAIHETDAGEASAYRIERGGALTHLNTQGGLGGGPCFVSVDAKGENVVTASYGFGSVASLPVRKDGALGKAVMVRNAGSGPNKGRQEGPHMHAIRVDARSRFAYACDLGTDEILVYPFDPKAGTLGAPDRTKTHPGAGPRHFAFGKDGRFAYVNDELDNTVVAYAVDEEHGALTAIQTLSSLPEGYKGNSHSAGIAVHPNGRWLYVSNRGHDSLAVFEIGKDGTLKPVEVKLAGVKEPRGFEIDPTGRWLVVAGQNSDDLAALPLDPKTGKLGDAASRVKVGKPVCVVFKG